MFRKLIASLCILALLVFQADAASGPRRVLWTGGANAFPAKSAVLDENFVTGQYFPGPITSDLVDTRSTTKYVTNASGAISQVGVNALPISNAGLLNEPAATNLQLQSLYSGWTSSNVTLNVASVTGPDGTLSAASMVDNATNGSHFAYLASPLQTFTSGQSYTVSRYVKANTASLFQFSTFNNAFGVGYVNYSLSGAGSVTASSLVTNTGIKNIGGGWYLCWATFTATSTNTDNIIGLLINSPIAGRGPSYVGTGTGIYMWNDQIEAGTVLPSSPILTTTATASRSADSIQIQRTGIGTLVLTFSDSSTQTFYPNTAAQFTIPVPLNLPLITRITGYAATAPLHQAVQTTAIPDQVLGAAQVATQQYVVAEQRCDSMQIVLPNFYSPSGVETSTGGTLTATVGVKVGSMIGTFYPGTFSGTSPGSTSGNLLISDEMAISGGIPAGSIIFVLAHGTSSNSTIPYTDNFQQVNASGMTQYGTTVPDPTTGATITNTTIGVGWGAVAVLCRHKGKAVCLFGDSIGYGYGPVISPYGILVPSLQSLPLLNMSVPGNAAHNFSSSHTVQLQLANYCSSAANQLGINDLISGDSAATLSANRAAMAALIPIPVIPTTITPSGTSTDNFATATNQTTAAYNSVRATFNTSVRALPTYLEITTPLEFGLNSGIWRSVGDGSVAAATTQTGSTYNGLHPTVQGYGDVTNAGTVTPGVFQ